MNLSKLAIIYFVLSFACHLTAQDTPDKRYEIEVLKKEIKQHSHLLDSLKLNLKKINNEIQEMPYWNIGFGGIVGMDFNYFSNWVGQGEYHNSSSASASTAFNIRGHLIGKDFFWRNNGKMTLAWKKLDFDNRGDNEFHKTADIVKINTHLGNKINEDIAMSMLGEWKSNILNQALSPSYMDWSIGITWTPNKEFLAVMHPMNYELILSDKDQFESSLGAKLVMEYDHQLTNSLQVTSNLSGFMSYENIEQLTNYTWTSGLNMKLMQNIGLGIEYALRVSPQETAAIESNEDVQSYVVMGVSYVLP